MSRAAWACCSKANHNHRIFFANLSLLTQWSKSLLEIFWALIQELNISLFIASQVVKAKVTKLLESANHNFSDNLLHLMNALV